MKVCKLGIISSITLILILMLLLFYLNRLLMLAQLKTVNLTPVVITASLGNALDNILIKYHDEFFLEGKNQSFVFHYPETIHIDKLWLDRCETTQENFAAFVRWSSIADISEFIHQEQPKNWRFFSTNQGSEILGQPLSPVTGVTYYDAFAYCRAAGGRLPTYREWQAASMGKKSHLYTWGNIFIDDAWPYSEAFLNSMQTCQRYGNDITADGIANLASHVSEWTVGPLNKPAISGGNGEEKPYELFALNMVTRYSSVESRNDFVGFRCAYDRKPVLSPWLSVIDSAPIAPGEYAIGTPKESRLPFLIQNSAIAETGVMKALSVKSHGMTAQKVTKFEISVNEYRYFLQDIFVKWRLYANTYEPLGHQYEPQDWNTQLENGHLPVRGVDWWSAYAFSRWAGGRLPSEEEWILLASNNDKTRYPWGDTYESVAVSLERKYIAPESNLYQTFDMNQLGVSHLSGNLSEWTSTLVPGPSGNRIVVKGGNYMLPGLDTSSMDYANYFLPTQRSPNTGFRVVFD